MAQRKRPSLRKFYQQMTPEEQAFLRRFLEEYKPQVKPGLSNDALDNTEDASRRRLVSLHKPVRSGLPDVPDAPLFRPEPRVMGGPQLQQLVSSLLDLAPELRGRLETVSGGWSDSVRRFIENEKIPKNEIDNLTGFPNILNGVTSDFGGSDVAISPDFTQPESEIDIEDLAYILAHEAGHVMGRKHGRTMDALEQLFDNRIDKILKRRWQTPSSR